MSNMSYCRFQNTLGDLIDCHEAMDDTAKLSFEERLARWNLIRRCCEIACDFGDEANEPRPKRSDAA